MLISKKNLFVYLFGYCCIFFCCFVTIFEDVRSARGEEEATDISGHPGRTGYAEQGHLCEEEINTQQGEGSDDVVGHVMRLWFM